MAVSQTVNSADSSASTGTSSLGRLEPRLQQAADLARCVRQWLGADVVVFDGDTGQLLIRQEKETRSDWDYFGELCREVARRGSWALLEEADPVYLLALPMTVTGAAPLVAVGALVHRAVEPEENLRPAARLLGLRTGEAREWISRQTPLAIEAAERLANLILAKLDADDRAEQMQREVESISSQIGRTFEEISLIYRLTQNLKLSSKSQELCQASLSWLADVIPAESFALVSLISAEDQPLQDGEQPEPVWFEYGNSLVDCEQFHALLTHLKLDTAARPTVVNADVTGSEGWPFPHLREMVIVPMTEGERRFGWLAAFNHTQGHEFGTQEASLLHSVATILGVHNSNTDLYRQQATLLAGVVRAMSSAIDAKDPYTRGHSDRVARVAVRLAQEMGCDEDTVKTLYLSGLLHDIGKIGIDDHVLRKPGKLTDAEYEHIKTHVEIGYRILRDLRKMSHVLPVVLHHHESWDGRGYPYGMSGTNIPFLARIAAVADAYDAMSSDRPYRKGMDDEKIDEILRSGAGKQWDPDVVDAFFRARDDIREISQRDSDQFDFDTLQWA